MQSSVRTIRVRIPDQVLEVREGETLLRSYPVSTSAWGVGSEPGSLKTPAGIFRIGEKIGGGASPGTVFRARVATGEVGGEEDPEDLVQTRILWLEGEQPENANTRDRYIYIHGTNHESQIGTPCSHGCVRMRNHDVIDLFDLVPAGTPVVIQP